jgi:hypothetical protein
MGEYTQYSTFDPASGARTSPAFTPGADAPAGSFKDERYGEWNPPGDLVSSDPHDEPGYETGDEPSTGTVPSNIVGERSGRDLDSDSSDNTDSGAGSDSADDGSDGEDADDFGDVLDGEDDVHETPFEVIGEFDDGLDDGDVPENIFTDGGGFGADDDDSSDECDCADEDDRDDPDCDCEDEDRSRDPGLEDRSRLVFRLALAVAPSRVSSFGRPVSAFSG